MAKRKPSPEAVALPGGGTWKVQGTGFDSLGRLVAKRPLRPKDRSGGPVLLEAAWPPRAAKGNAVDSGRIFQDELRTNDSAAFTISSA